jgi:hypothetical protein
MLVRRMNAKGCASTNYITSWNPSAHHITSRFRSALKRCRLYSPRAQLVTDEQSRLHAFTVTDQDACTQRHRCVAALVANILNPAHIPADVFCGRSHKIHRFWMPANKGSDQATGAILLGFYSWSDYDDST